MKPPDSTDSSTLPESVVRVSSLLIAIGILDVVGALAVNMESLLHTGRGVNCGGGAAMDALIGIALLRRSSLARLFALFCCWTAFIVLPALLIYSFFQPGSIVIACAGFSTTAAQSPIACGVVFLLHVALSISLFRVLTQPSVVAWFKRETATGKGV